MISRLVKYVILSHVAVMFLAGAFGASPASPPENSIPIIGQRICTSTWPTYEGIRLEQLCQYMWKLMTGTHGWEWAVQEHFQTYYGYCEDIGMLVVLTPSELGQYQYPTSDERGNWYRNLDFPLTSDSAFSKVETDYSVIVGFVSADSMWVGDSIGICPEVNDLELLLGSGERPSIWFYYLLDEAAARQRRHMLEYDNYQRFFPNIYSQAWDDSVTCGSYDSVPALDYVLPSGMYSWLKYAAEDNDSFPVPSTINFSLLCSIEPGEYEGAVPSYGGTLYRQATCVDALCNALYQEPYSSGVPPSPVSNAPEFIQFDYYPFRYVDSDYDSVTTMCDTNWVFLIELLEAGLDSTIVTALENDVTTYYIAQAFGVNAGPRLYDEDTGEFHYISLTWRKPAPQEFLLGCNLALLHQAKGIFPYSLRSYLEDPAQLEKEWNFLSSALLDCNLIPFDADYEEYVYAGRCPVSDTLYQYLDPTMIPPWSDGFDPLFSMTSPPTDTTDVKYLEDYSEWMFRPYGDLYRTLRSNLAQIVRIGPEMYDLFWMNGYEDEVLMSTTLTNLPIHWVTPRIKVFENPGSDRCYLFYLNTFCRAEEIPFRIVIDSDDLPGWVDCTDRLLDHSRRFIMEGTESPRGTFTFLDTLGPGEARLVELIDTSDNIPADVRITDNDVRALLPARGDTTSDMWSVPGEGVYILSRFYNMGTGSSDPIVVGLYDTSEDPEVTIDTDTIRFSGLPYSSGSCRESDMEEVSFYWDNIAVSDIGPHRLEVRAAPWLGEPDTSDNTAHITFLVEPNDWATEELDDPWDMTESGDSAWHTDDISSMYGWVTASFTDSVSGMFEGSVDYDYRLTNRMTLNLGGETLDGDDWEYISLIGKTDVPCDVYLRWETSIPSVSEVKIGEMGSWGILEYDDLGSNPNWAGKTITALSLSFRAQIHTVNVPVRIGWVRLENGRL